MEIDSAMRWACICGLEHRTADDVERCVRYYDANPDVLTAEEIREKLREEKNAQ